MKTSIRAILLLLLMSTRAFAQFPSGTAANPVGANLAVQDAGTCSTSGAFLWQKLPTNALTTTVNLAGTFSATVTIRESNNGGATWFSAGTQNSVGTQMYSSNGFTDFCVDVTTYVSGTLNITVATGQQSVTGGLPLTAQVTVPFSATPTFTFVAGSFETIYFLTLTGNVTSSTLIGGIVGSDICFIITQDATGGRTFSYPSNVANGAPLLAGGNQVSSSCYNFNGSSWQNLDLTPGGSIGGLTNNFILKSNASSTPVNSLCDEGVTTANAMTCTDTAGIRSPAFTSTGATAGFADFPQGTTSAAVAPCNTATSICEQAPTAVTSYLIVKPGVASNGVETNVVASAVDTQGFSGDANHSAIVTTGSGTSIGSTSLCSTANCPVGTYRVNVYLDITTACGTSGTYLVNLIYTDDQGAKTIPVNINGTGSVPATGVLTTTSTANFGENAQIIRSTGAASINYSTTAVACGTAGPMVGKLYLSVEPVQ